MATPIPSMAGSVPQGNLNTIAANNARATMPGFRAGESLQAAAPVAEAQIKMEQASQQAAFSAKDKEIALAFRQLLSKGIEGAQAYVEDLKQMEGMQDVAQLAEQQLTSIAPIWSDPNLGSDTHERTLSNFYKSIDTQIKRKLDPSFEEKLNLQKNKEIEAAKEKAKINKEVYWKTRRSDANNRLGIIRQNIAEFKKTEPNIETLPVVQNKLQQKEEELRVAKNDLAKTLKDIEERPQNWVKRHTPFFEDDEEKRDRLQKEIASLEAVIADPTANISVLMKDATEEEINSVNSFNEQLEDKRKEYNRQLYTLEQEERKVSAIAGAKPEPLSFESQGLNAGAPPTSGATGVKSASPAASYTADRSTNAGKIKILTDALKRETKEANKQRIKAAIKKLKEYGN